MRRVSIADRRTPERAADWRDQAACKNAKDDAWFPHPTNAVAVHTAKQTCFGCPVMLACAQGALQRREADGVWGGLSEPQRAALLRKHHAAKFDDTAFVRGAVLNALRDELNPLRSLRDLWNDRTYPLPDGHIGWTGDSGSFSFRGHGLPPKQLAFLIDRGYKATGIVRRLPTCLVMECVHPRHLADNAERYQQKRAVEEAEKRAALAAEVVAEMAS